MIMKMKSLLAASIPMAALAVAHGQILISGYMANPASTDSPYEYVQLMATANVDFSSTPMAVVFANSTSSTPGTANGWIQGGSTTYELSLTSGSVTAGQVFYVGGSGELLNGSGSASIADQTWIRAVNTATTGGDLFGSAASGGVVGNGGSQADGIAVFNTTTLTATTVPIDAIFYGSAVGTASTGTSSGYTLPVNDLYTGGVLQSGSALMPDPAGGQYTQLTGSYNPGTGTWTGARTGALLTPAVESDLNTQITLVPEPASGALALLGLVTGVAGILRSRKS